MTTRQWEVTGPRVIDIGEPGQQVRAVEVSIIGGHVAVVPVEAGEQTGTVEIGAVTGPPLIVEWDGHDLRVRHGKASGSWDLLRRLTGGEELRAVVSVSVPGSARVKVNAVLADVVASGLREGVSVNTVSGSLTVSDVTGPVALNTVSGNAELDGLHGAARLNTVSGEIIVQDSAIDEAKVSTVSGNVLLDLQGPTLRLRANSVSGDVTVRAPYTGYDVRTSAVSGQVVVDGRSYAGPHKGASQTIREGDGSLDVRASLVSGSLVLLHRDPPQDSTSPQDSFAPTPQDAR